jgi:hypothetical protein
MDVYKNNFKAIFRVLNNSLQTISNLFIGKSCPKQNNALNFTFYLLTFMIISSFSSCKKVEHKHIPKAVAGILDLRDWDFDKDGNIDLAGEWEYYYKGFLDDEDFDTLQSKFFLGVPGTWDNLNWNDQKMDAIAFGSYRLKIIVKQTHTNLAIKLPNQATAYKFFVNGAFIC